MAESYYELLKHPEWQKKRLRCMEAAEFACCDCLATDRTLNVHHRYYTKGAKPWEYPDDALVCLCEECHEERHRTLDEAKKLIGLLDQSDLSMTVGYVKGLLLRREFQPRAEGSLPLNQDGFACLPTNPTIIRDGKTGETSTEENEVMGLGDAWNLRHVDFWIAFCDITSRNGGVTHADLHSLGKAKREWLANSAVAAPPAANDLLPANTADCRM